MIRTTLGKFKAFDEIWWGSYLFPLPIHSLSLSLPLSLSQSALRPFNSLLYHDFAFVTPSLTLAILHSFLLRHALPLLIHAYTTTFLRRATSSHHFLIFLSPHLLFSHPHFLYNSSSRTYPTLAFADPKSPTLFSFPRPVTPSPPRCDNRPYKGRLRGTYVLCRPFSSSLRYGALRLCTFI